MTAESDLSIFYEKAYIEHSDAIFRHCYFRMGDYERAKELMQDAFMQTWKCISKGEKIDNLRAFLYKTATNLIIDELRRRKRRPTSSLEEMQEGGFDPGSDDEEKAIKMGIDAKFVFQTLQKIDPKYRDVLMMRYIDELKPAEIANITGLPVNVVSVRIHRGEKLLRSHL